MAPKLERGLYLVTRECVDEAGLLATVQAALAGGAVAVQYRDKSGDGARRLAQGKALVALCREYGRPLIVNDDVVLARAVGAAGVHLGEHDAEFALAREFLGPAALIGVSCYNDMQRAQAAALAGADYIAFGSFFDSPTKPGARRATTGLLVEAAGLGIPRVAIGGINHDNAGALIAAGADLVAVISTVFDAPDPRAAAQRIANLFVLPTRNSS
jgi:thiamine-phosphate pyrophosphorylase